MNVDDVPKFATDTTRNKETPAELISICFLLFLVWCKLTRCVNTGVGFAPPSTPPPYHLLYKPRKSVPGLWM